MFTEAIKTEIINYLKKLFLTPALTLSEHFKTILESSSFFLSKRRSLRALNGTPRTRLYMQLVVGSLGRCDGSTEDAETGRRCLKFSETGNQSMLYVEETNIQNF